MSNLCIGCCSPYCTARLPLQGMHGQTILQTNGCRLQSTCMQVSALLALHQGIPTAHSSTAGSYPNRPHVPGITTDTDSSGRHCSTASLMAAFSSHSYAASSPLALQAGSMPCSIRASSIRAASISSAAVQQLLLVLIKSAADCTSTVPHLLWNHMLYQVKQQQCSNTGRCISQLTSSLLCNCKNWLPAVWSRHYLAVDTSIHGHTCLSNRPCWPWPGIRATSAVSATPAWGAGLLEAPCCRCILH